MSHWPAMVPPVGSPIRPRLRGRRSQFDWTFDDRYWPVFVYSGTSALQLAIRAACIRSGRNGSIWIPAYGCPDILSAALAANSRAVLYDVDTESPFISADQRPPEDLAAAVAAHFVGLPHPPELIRSCIAGSDAVLIEDSAQRFPMPDDTLYGDAVVLSFGRGKPLSLMEGGCLLVGERLLPHVSELVRSAGTWRPNLSGSAKRLLHDLALQPAVFGLVRKLPGVSLGQVAYKTASPAQLADHRFAQLASLAATTYQSEAHWLVDQHATQAFVARHFPRLRPLQIADRVPTSRLSRIPCIAADAAAAAKACNDAMSMGIAATRMYRNALPTIHGVPPGITGPWCHAASLAERLVTLPVMPQVTIDRLEISRSVPVSTDTGRKLQIRK